MIKKKYHRTKKINLFFLAIIFQMVGANVFAQQTFADKCIGNWEGMLYIYGKGQLRDSVPVQLLVEKTSTPDTWIWKTKYLSTTNPMEKNYKLVLKDAATQSYITDEGEGVELADYCFNNKLYSVFETHDILLTSSYEWQGNQLIFEVTSGKKMDEKNDVTSFSVLNVQRVVFKKVVPR